MASTLSRPSVLRLARDLGSVRISLAPTRPLGYLPCLSADFPARWAHSHGSDTPESAMRFVTHEKNPITNKLWTARGAAKDNAEQFRACLDLESPLPPSKSRTEVSYNFTTDEYLKETYRNPWGQIRNGRVLEDLDALAGNVAFAHVQDPRSILVTASVDRIQYRGTPDIKHDQHLTGRVTYVGTSSMEIQIICEEDGGNKWLEAYFTFVATDPFTKRPERIRKLIPETKEDQAVFEEAADRAAAKKKARQQQKQGGGQYHHDASVEKKATELLQEAGPLLTMPSLANPHSILVNQTILQTVEIAQPQSRNTANQIFGGFLMRRACELAWANAYAFAGAKPILYEVDQVQFSSPVNVGDMLNFHSRVLYSTVKKDGLPEFTGMEGQTNVPLVSVEVEAWIVDPGKTSAKLSNQFCFTFALPGDTPVRTVLPGNMEAARMMASRMTAD